jgi:hypothetical protein
VALQLTHVLAELEEKHQFRDVLGGKLPAGPRSPNAERAAGLNLLETRRREGVAPAKLYDERGESWGCALVAIPELDYAVHVARNPELKSKDAETRNRAWHKFFRQFGTMYGLDESVGKRRPNAGRIIVK